MKVRDNLTTETREGTPDFIILKLGNSVQTWSNHVFVLTAPTTSLAKSICQSKLEMFNWLNARIAERFIKKAGRGLYLAASYQWLPVVMMSDNNINFMLENVCVRTITKTRSTSKPSEICHFSSRSFYHQACTY